MKVQELLSALGARGGDTSAVYRGSGNPEDRYCIVCEAGSWQVYYSERGTKYELRDHLTEEQACAYLWSLLESDDTIWK